MQNPLSTNRMTLFDSCKAVTDQTPTDYMRVLQLEEAKELFDGLAIESLEQEWKEHPVLHI